MKKTMRGLGWTLVSAASIAYAAPDGGSGGSGLLGYLFMGFFTLVIVSQLAPAGLLFYSMIKGVFGSGEIEDHGSARLH
jgi:hypothetical protein